MSTQIVDSQAIPRGFRILVPLDGSSSSARALHYASGLPGREITLLHVHPEDMVLVPGVPVIYDNGHEKGAIEELEALAAPLRTADRAVNVVVLQGDVAEAILNTATGFDLIVMSTHGRGAAGRILFGSIADRVTRHTSTPTLLIRRNEQEGDLPAPGRVVVPLDGSDTAERALPFATNLADTLSLPLHLLRAVDLDAVRLVIQEKRRGEVASSSATHDTDATFEDSRREAERQATEYLTNVADEIEAQGIDVQTGILEGTPAFVLLWNIEPTDLVVMTSHGRSGFRRWMLGSVAEKLVREATAPILLVPTRKTSS